jgi:uncharacterized membrane protein
MKQMDNFFGFRLGSSILIWLILYTTIIQSHDSQVILSSMILYFIPIALDYFGQSPLKEKNEKRRNLAFWISIGLTVLCLGLLMTHADLTDIIDSIISKIIIFVTSSGFVAAAVVDWVTYSSESEVAHREKTREHQRNQQTIYKFEDRVKENKPMKNTGESYIKGYNKNIPNEGR